MHTHLHTAVFLRVCECERERGGGREGGKLINPWVSSLPLYFFFLQLDYYYYYYFMKDKIMKSNFLTPNHYYAPPLPPRPRSSSAYPAPPPPPATPNQQPNTRSEGAWLMLTGASWVQIKLMMNKKALCLGHIGNLAVQFRKPYFSGVNEEKEKEEERKEIFDEPRVDCAAVGVLQGRWRGRGGHVD